MLPDYIINEIKKREHEKECADEWCIECPIPEYENEPNSEPLVPTSEERGVAILDFTI